MNNFNCNDDELRQLLVGDEDADAAAHLEACPRCQLRLEELAASPVEWREARQYFHDTSAENEKLDAEIRERPWSDVLRSGGSHEAKPAWTESMAKQLLAPPSHPEMLGRLGRYEVERLIGSGGMGIVFKAFDTELNRPVAIKVLAPHLAGSGAARQRFSREARAAAAVVHEHVVAIHNVEAEGAAPFLVMQYVAGESLQARLDRLGFLTLTEILRIAHQTAAGLAAAHAQGLVHRDVKPSNILLEQKVERALLTDFGLARAADDASLTHTGYLPGTPHYMSPEQARGDAVDVRSDLFSLGSVLYAMCTGRPPFRADTNFGVLRRITDTEPRPIREVNAEIPAWLAAVVARLLAKQPTKRFESAGAVADVLQQCLAHVQQPEAVKLPDVCGLRQVRGSERGPILFVAAFALTVIVAALTLFFATSHRPPARETTGQTTAEAPADTSPALVDWDAVANEINAAANDASQLEQKTELLWNSQPTSATPDESELEPNP